jgi:ribose 5-phosphate isomerase B
MIFFLSAYPEVKSQILPIFVRMLNAVRMNIAVACDHAGFETKLLLLDYLRQEGHVVIDLGAYSAEPADYPEFGHAIAHCVAEGQAEFGISLCGSGNGINMTANKHPAIRSALCWTAEIAELARRHNNANICALPARFITIEEARRIAGVFITTPFDGGRHQRRIDKIPL